VPGLAASHWRAIAWESRGSSETPDENDCPFNDSMKTIENFTTPAGPNYARLLRALKSNVGEISRAYPEWFFHSSELRELRCVHVVNSICKALNFGSTHLRWSLIAISSFPNERNVPFLFIYSMNEEGISHASLKQDETEAIIFITRNPDILQRTRWMTYREKIANGRGGAVDILY